MTFCTRKEVKSVFVHTIYRGGHGGTRRTMPVCTVEFGTTRLVHHTRDTRSVVYLHTTVFIFAQNSFSDSWYATYTHLNSIFEIKVVKILKIIHRYRIAVRCTSGRHFVSSVNLPKNPDVARSCPIDQNITSLLTNLRNSLEASCWC